MSNHSPGQARRATERDLGSPVAEGIMNDAMGAAAVGISPDGPTADPQLQYSPSPAGSPSPSNPADLESPSKELGLSSNSPSYQPSPSPEQEGQDRYAADVSTSPWRGDHIPYSLESDQEAAEEEDRRGERER